MSFSYLPAPIYIALMIIASIGMFVTIFIRYKNDGILLTISYFLLGFAGIFVAAYKLLTVYLAQYSILISIVLTCMYITTALASILIFVAAYLKVRYDRHKRIILIIIILITLSCVISILYSK